MTTRTRTRSAAMSSGTHTRLSTGLVTTSNPTLYREDCVDVADDFGADHPFDLDRSENGIQPLNGQTFSIGGTMLGIFENFVPTIQDMNGTVSHLTGLSSAPTNGALMSELLAKTNPSRPVVDLPVFFSELRELPGLVRFAGNSLLKRGASAYLSYEFGWKPLIGDLTSLLDFQSHFDKRAKEIHGIFDGGGIKRRRDLRDETVLDESNLAIHTTSGTVRSLRRKVTRRRIWATTRWVPDQTKLPPRTDREVRRLARKAVLGLDLTPATLWQAVPWTWLIDWFSSAGDYLEAHRNTVPAVHQRGCVMTMTETYASWAREPGIDAHALTLSGGSGLQYRVTKRRVVQINPTIAAYMPMLTRRQVSILGALSVLKGRR